jgi:DNA gyrase subunit A
MIAHKKKAPRRVAGAGEAQAMLDLMSAGAAEPEDPDNVDVGGDEEFDESLLDE